jgi:drug/metabolite transporter (DMT)-like permease
VTARQAGLLLLQALCWGATYPLVALSLRGFSPGEVVFGRCLLATVVLAVALRVQGGSVTAALEELRRRPWPAAALALLAFVVPHQLIAHSQEVVPAGLTGVLIASFPLWSAILALRFDREETVDVRQALGLMVGIVGVGLVVGVETVGSVPEALGAAAILFSAGCFAVSTFVIKRFYGPTNVTPTTRSFLSLGLASIVLAPAGLGGGTPDEGAGPWISLVLLAAVSTGFGVVLLFWLVDELGTRRAALASYLAPGFSVLLAAIFLGEPVTVSAVLGLGLIVGGVALASSPRRTVDPLAYPDPEVRRTKA